MAGLERSAPARAAGAALAVALLVSPLAAHAQTPAPADPFRAGVARVQPLVRAGRAAEALALLDSLESAARGRGDARQQLAARVARAGALWLTGRAGEAEPIAADAVRRAAATADTVSLAEALRWQGASLGALGRFDQARGAWLRLGELGRAAWLPEYEGHSHLGLGYLAGMRGDVGTARIQDRLAARKFHAAGSAYWEAWAWTTLGHLHSHDGEIAAARLAYESAGEAARRGGVREYELHTANNLGVLEHRAGDPARALEYFEQARGLGRGLGDPRAELSAAANVAFSLSLQMRYDEAAALLDSTIAEARQHGFSDVEASARMTLGDVRRLQGRRRESERVLRSVLDLGDAAPPVKRLEAAMSLMAAYGVGDSAAAALATMERLALEYGDRLPIATRAEVAYVVGDRLIERGDLPAALEQLRRAERLYLQAGQRRGAIGSGTLAARAFRMLGRPDSALAALERSRRLWEDMRGRIEQPEWREWFAYFAKDLHVERARLELETGADEPSLRAARAFDAIQPFTARTLLERIRRPGTAADSGAGAPGEIATLASIQAVLAEDEALLDVVCGTRASVLFAVTRRSVSAARVVATADTLDRKFLNFQRLLRQPRSADGDAALRATRSAIGRQLFGGLAGDWRSARRILYSPDGAFHRLPLAALAADSAPDAPPLIENAECVSLPSASILLRIRRSGATAGRAARIFAFAGPSSAGRVLPGARGEVGWLHSRFASVERWQGPGSLAAVRPELERADVLHFAGHSEADPRQPWRSGLLLGEPDSLSGDRFLRAAGVNRMTLPARLAVLASCSSAEGRILQGEGMLGLADAFIAAGVRSVVATAWPIEDRPAVALTRDFYEGLARGETVAGALRSAQLRRLREPGAAGAGDWAGFLVIGDPETRVRLPGRPAGWPIGGMLLILVALAVGRMRARRAGVTNPAAAAPRE